jgi:guanylate kinase
MMTSLFQAPSKPVSLMIVSGPSGVGKGTVCAQLRTLRPDLFESISTTTRSPRPGEVDGQQYHFVTIDQFEAAIRQEAFLEWACYNHQYYGTQQAPVEAAMAGGKPVLLEIDPQGAFQIKQRLPQAVLVFIAPPTLEELERRLRVRGTEDEAKIEQRLAIARQEIELQDRFDVVIVNHQVAQTAAALADMFPPLG